MPLVGVEECAGDDWENETRSQLKPSIFSRWREECLGDTFNLAWLDQQLVFTLQIYLTALTRFAGSGREGFLRSSPCPSKFCSSSPPTDSQIYGILVRWISDPSENFKHCSNTKCSSRNIRRTLMTLSGIKPASRSNSSRHKERGNRRFWGLEEACAQEETCYRALRQVVRYYWAVGEVVKVQEAPGEQKWIHGSNNVLTPRA